MPRVKKEVSKEEKVKTSDSVGTKASEAKTSRLANARSENIVRAQSKTTNLSVPVYSLAGQKSGTLSLPKEIFGQKINKQLLAQAMRVYLTNQKTLLASTKTRGEVVGSTAKIYRQKGTGRARHGAIRAPIFVGGGIVFGPKPRKVRLTLPKKMKKTALLSALSEKAENKEILAVSGLEKASGKTKEVFSWLNKIKVNNALIVTGEKIDNIVRAVRNIPEVSVLPANLINAYEVLRHNFLIVTKDAVEKMNNQPVIASPRTLPFSGTIARNDKREEKA